MNCFPSKINVCLQIRGWVTGYANFFPERGRSAALQARSASRSAAPQIELERPWSGAPYFAGALIL